MSSLTEVDLVHMGNRQNPEEEPPKAREDQKEPIERDLSELPVPKVRFSTPEAAQRLGWHSTS